VSVDQCPALIGPVGDAARAVGPVAAPQWRDGGPCRRIGRGECGSVPVARSLFGDGGSRRGGVDVYARGSRHQSGGGRRDGRRIPRSAEDRHCHDTSGSLTNRLVTITGFVLNQRDGVYLARIVIICCAADGQLARIHLRGPASGSASRFADNTCLRVERRVESGVPIPTLDAVTVRRVDAPANPNV
jgi:hypothetical protein